MHARWMSTSTLAHIKPCPELGRCRTTLKALSPTTRQTPRSMLAATNSAHDPMTQTACSFGMWLLGLVA